MKTYEEIVKQYPNCIVIAVVVERDERNRAIGFNVLESTKSRSTAEYLFKEYEAKGVEYIPLSTYCAGSIQRFVKQKADAALDVKSRLKPAETALFYRQYYGW